MIRDFRLFRLGMVFHRLQPVAFTNALDIYEEVILLRDDLVKFKLEYNDTVDKLNKLVEEVNALIKLMEEFMVNLNENIEEIIYNKIEQMLTDGEFDDILERILGDGESFRQYEEDNFVEKVKREFAERFYNVVWDNIYPDNNISDRLQAIIDRGIKRIFIPDGTYLVDKTITLTENVEIKMSKNCILKRSENSVYCIFTNGYTNYTNQNANTHTYTASGYNGYGNIKISGGTLDCNSSFNTNSGGISFAHSHDVLIENVIIRDVYNIHHIEINSSNNFKVVNCKFIGFRHNGTRDFSEAIQIDLAAGVEAFPLFGEYDYTTSTAINISNCLFVSVGRGIGTHYMSTGRYQGSLTIDNCEFRALLNNAINLEGFFNSSISNILCTTSVGFIDIKSSYEININNVKCKLNTGSGLTLTSAEKIAISNVQFNNSNSGFLFDVANNINITNVIMNNTINHMIYLTNSNDLIFDNIRGIKCNNCIYAFKSYRNIFSNFNIKTCNNYNVKFVDVSVCSLTNMQFQDSNLIDNEDRKAFILSNFDNSNINNLLMRRGSGFTTIGIELDNTCDNITMIGCDFRTAGSTTNFIDNGNNTIKLGERS